MTLLHLALGLLALYLVVRLVQSKQKNKNKNDSPLAELSSLEPWLTEAVERELARGVQNIDAAKLGKSLRGNPDPEVEIGRAHV